MSPSTSRRSAWRLSPLRLLQLALVTGFVGLLVLNTDFALLSDALQGIDGRLLLLIVALNLPVLLLVPLRSGLILRSAGYRAPANILFSTSVLGYVAGGLTPAATGELLRVQALHNSVGVPVDRALAVATYERVLSLYMQMLALVPLVAAVALSPRWGLLAAAAALLAWAISIFAASIILGRLPPESNVKGNGIGSRGLRYLLRLSQQLSFLVSNRRLYVWTSLISAALLALFDLQAWLMCRSLSDAISLPEAAVAYMGSLMASVASLIPLGAGVGDGSMAALLRKFGLTLEQGEVVALVLRVLVTLPLLLTALGCYLYLQGRSPLPESAEAPAP